MFKRVACNTNTFKVRGSQCDESMSVEMINLSVIRNDGFLKPILTNLFWKKLGDI